MKKLLTLLPVLIFSIVSAQNWSPILVNEKMNYQHSDSAYISHTIWVDSSFYTDDDSIFYLNRIVKDVPGYPLLVLRNQPQFLSKFIVKQDYGIWACSEPYYFIISTQSGLGSPWSFTGTINAEVTELLYEDVFGVQDSVKVISLSDGHEIRLSKNFGILKFPDFENGGYFELVGIQDTEYGESVIDFWDIFDFNVGDVFQYDFELGDASVFDFETQKFTVEVKTVYDDSIKYQMHVVIDGHHIDYYSWEEYFYSYWTTTEVCYIDSLNHPSNKFNYEIVRMWDDYWGFSWDMKFFSKTFLSKDTLNILTKKCGSLYVPLENYEIYVETDTNYNDTLIREQGWFTYDVLVQYKQGLGRTIYDFLENEQSLQHYLEGYVKNGDTVGIITPDSLLLTKITKHKTILQNWIIYPIPTYERLYIKQSNHNYTYNFEIRDLRGRLVKQEKNIKSSNYAMNVADLKAGVYFYVIKENDEIKQQGKLVIQ